MSSALKKIRQSVLEKLPLRLRFALRYMAIHGKFTLLIRPKTFTEKLFLRMAVDRRPILVTFSDKLLAKDFVRKRVGNAFLNEVLWVGTDPKTIPWDSLPRKFVIKTNHGSGHFHIVTDKSSEDRITVARMFENWLSEDYGGINRQWAYSQIRRKVFIESFIDAPQASDGEIPWDFRFFVFNGEIRIVEVDFGGVALSTSQFYTPEWTLLPVRRKYPIDDRALNPPRDFPKMLQLAKLIGKEMDFVRIDMYQSSDGPIVGELTCYPAGGTYAFHPPSYDRIMGDCWKFEGKYYKA